jgi:hypothetical protein
VIGAYTGSPVAPTWAFFCASFSGRGGFGSPNPRSRRGTFQSRVRYNYEATARCRDRGPLIQGPSLWRPFSLRPVEPRQHASCLHRHIIGRRVGDARLRRGTFPTARLFPELDSISQTLSFAPVLAAGAFFLCPGSLASARQPVVSYAASHLHDHRAIGVRSHGMPPSAFSLPSPRTKCT